MSVAYIDCSSKDISCSKIGFQSATVYLEGTEIHSLNYLEIAAQILEHLPDAELVDQESLEAILQLTSSPFFYNLIILKLII